MYCRYYRKTVCAYKYRTCLYRSRVQRLLLLISVSCSTSDVAGHSWWSQQHIAPLLSSTLTYLLLTRSTCLFSTLLFLTLFSFILFLPVSQFSHLLPPILSCSVIFFRLLSLLSSYYYTVFSLLSFPSHFSIPFPLLHPLLSPYFFPVLSSPLLSSLTFPSPPLLFFFLFLSCLPFHFLSSSCSLISSPSVFVFAYVFLFSSFLSSPLSPAPPVCPFPILSYPFFPLSFLPLLSLFPTHLSPHYLPSC